MKSILALIASCLVVVWASSQTHAVKPGIEVLRERGFDIVKGKAVGLITNPTGVDHRLTSTIDILFQAPGVKLAALFGPEHGVRGDYAAGDEVESYTDAATGVPVYSLYGKTWKPTPEMLKGIDILVYDIQDIGCRSYTYISTMGLAMDAAAERGIPFVVLDRPNPLGGLRIEGNIVEQGYTSFVSHFAVPYVYGLTCGELARFLNGQAMLAGGKRCSLIVVPMEGWKRSMTFDRTDLPWVPTSPHVPHIHSPAYYVSTGVMGELGVISEGVGYTLPFQVVGAEWIDGVAFAERLNALKLPGVIFRPITYKPFYGKDQGKTLHGVQIHIIDATKLNLMSVQFLLMQVHHDLYPNKDPFALAESSRLRMFDKVAGTNRIREIFAQSYSYADIRPYLEKDVEPFRAASKRYRLYNAEE
jgi:uncharacterized protein YbbC (DUF1343 family)